MFEYSNLDIQSFLNKPSGIIWWKKDKDSIYTEANDECAKLFGFKKSEDIIGIKDVDLYSELSESADFCVKSDKEVMLTKNLMKMIQTCQYQTNNKKFLLINKTPLIGQNKVVVGTFAYCIDITKLLNTLSNFVLSDQVKFNDSRKVLGNKYVIGNKLNHLKLTARESECLFFLLRGKTAKEIAVLLKLSYRTVENYFEQLKVKFDVQTKGELITKAIEFGFFNIIPTKILEIQLFLVFE